MSSGVFSPDPVKLNISREQLPAAPGHRARIQADQLSDLLILAVTDLHRLESGVETTLFLIERAVEQHNRRLELLRQYPQASPQAQRRRMGLMHLAGRKLALAGGPIMSQARQTPRQRSARTSFNSGAIRR